jgi:hypothetical protein
MGVRQNVGVLVNTLIPEDRWEETIYELDRQGRIDQKTMLSIIILLAKTIERMEKNAPVQSIKE